MNKEQTVEELIEIHYPIDNNHPSGLHRPLRVSERNAFRKGYTLGQSQSGWVDVNERLPNDFTWKNKMISCTQEYQIYDEVFGISKAWLKKWNCDNSDTLIPRKKDEVLWECQHHNFNNVTHWQPLPTPPLNR